LDKDGNGSLSLDELQEWLLEMGKDVRGVEAMVKALDKDGSKQVGSSGILVRTWCDLGGRLRCGPREEWQRAYCGPCDAALPPSPS
jgi:hypothetical protein